MRTPCIAGNWKMNLDRRAARELAARVRDHAEGADGVEVALFPSFVYLDEVVRAVSGTAVGVGGQNVCDEPEGPFTGEVSVAMLNDVGATIALIGHSERRHVYGETDELIQRKVRAALDGGLRVFLCIGETLEQREAGQTEPVCSRQLRAGLEGVSASDLAQVVVAYEPVWAIGTGKTATPEMAGAVHEYCRGVLAGLYDEAAADRTRILYGGSVKPDNAADLLAVPDIDGALVGGASLKADAFLPIIDAGVTTSST